MHTGAQTVHHGAATLHPRGVTQPSNKLHTHARISITVPIHHPAEIRSANIYACAVESSVPHYSAQLSSAISLSHTHTQPHTHYEWVFPSDIQPTPTDGTHLK